MRVSVFGLGYVGSVSAACIAEAGHTVIGIDANGTKVDLINDGKAPVFETGLGELIAKNVATGRLHANQDETAAIRDSDMSVICVGTPSNGNGSLNLDYVRRVCEQIGAALAEHDDFHVVMMRSTMLPGSMHEVVIPALEKASGKRAGSDFGIAINPEFLRESTAVYDYYNPPKIVIGANDERSAQVVASVYDGIEAPRITTQIEVAEMVKYADNAWHAVKVGFANEIGNIGKRLGIDSHKVMEIFCQDTKLNLSPYYLKPGFAFGGSCLPKDLRALNYAAGRMDLKLPILASVLESNRLQIQHGIDMVTKSGSKKVGMLGLSFKAGTDDLRESPNVEVIETLIGKGYDIRIYDENVKLSWLVGANREFIETHIPHISRLMVDRIEDVLDHAEVIIIGNKAPQFLDVVDRLKNGQQVIDFVRILDTPSVEGKYLGICW